MKNKKTWYDKYIESEIRPMVKLLRDNGVNTYESCGHDMWISVDGIHVILFPVDEVLWNNGYKNFIIEVYRTYDNHYHWWGKRQTVGRMGMRIWFPLRNGKYSNLKETGATIVDENGKKISDEQIKKIKWTTSHRDIMKIIATPDNGIKTYYETPTDKKGWIK